MPCRRACEDTQITRTPTRASFRCLGPRIIVRLRRRGAAATGGCCCCCAALALAAGGGMPEAAGDCCPGACADLATLTAGL